MGCLDFVTAVQNEALNDGCTAQQKRRLLPRPCVPCFIAPCKLFKTKWERTVDLKTLKPCKYVHSTITRNLDGEFFHDVQVSLLIETCRAFLRPSSSVVTLKRRSIAGFSFLFKKKKQKKRKDQSDGYEVEQIGVDIFYFVFRFHLLFVFPILKTLSWNPFPKS